MKEKTSQERVEGPRGCTPYEVAPALDLMNLVFRHPDEPTVGTQWAHVYRESNCENMRIMKVNGKVVAHSGILYEDVQSPRGVIKLAGIGSVCCHPDYRKRGYASAVVEDCAKKMRADGASVGLLGTGILDWYRRMGWELAGRCYSFQVDAGNIELLPELKGAEMAEGLENDLENILELYKAHGLGAERTPELFSVLLGRPGTEIYTARRNGKLLAYIIASGTSVDEYGGDVPTVAGLIRNLYQRKRSSAGATSERCTWLSLTTPHIETGLPGLLVDSGFAPSRDYLGMMKITDARVLLEGLGLGDIKVEEEADKIALTYKGKKIELSGRQLVKLVFGPERVADFLPDVFPVTFYQWPLDRI